MRHKDQPSRHHAITCRFNGFAKADVIGDEQVYARQRKRFTQGLKRVRVEADAGAEGCRKKARIGGCATVPPHRLEVGCKVVGGVESPGSQRLPAPAPADLRIDLVLPQDFQRFALGVIIDTEEANERGVSSGRLDAFFDEI